ncbi:hypothetical protein GOP47_0012465 [Adiantum capillus-veneris]|uniref:Uncharacterized protein n=1 Tax=Adiantum capillus-veneris TaxID=13818 RepID=A0A9D4UR75_ADICA|nr:hypothetical protein GOP47_0012465 [Adiantum capillus-veneris]
MAPPINRRSKQSSSPSPSPNPLPGIAIGIFAAVAASFAARRALRWKRSLQSKNDREHADLEFLVNAKKDGLLSQKGSGDEDEGQKEEAEALDGKKIANAEGGVRKVKTVEEGESIDEDGEISEITVKVKATLTLDGPSLKALQSVVVTTSEEREEEEEQEAEEANYIGTVEDEDTGEDGDDDRSSAGQLPSPVLINGRLLEFFVDEMSDLKDEQDHSTSGCNSLSDSMSESSLQEVSSAPVKPLVLADEAMETSLVATTPSFVGASEQVGQEDIHVVEDKSCSEVEAKKGGELPAMEEIISPPADEGFDSNEGFTDSSDELDVDGKPLPTRNSCNNVSNSEINEVNVEILSDNCVALEGEFLMKLKGEGTESARVNGKLLSDARSLGEFNNLDSTSSETTVQAETESPNEDFNVTLRKEALPEPACINGKVLFDKASNYPCQLVGFTPDDGSSLQSAQEVAYRGFFETAFERNLQATMGVSEDIPHATGKVEHLGPSVEDMPGIGNNDEINPQVSKGDDVHVGNLDLPDMPKLEIEGLIDSQETMGVSTNNQVVDVHVQPATQEWTKKVTGLVSIEEAPMQSTEHDVHMVDSRNNDIPFATHDMESLKEDPEVSINNLVVDNVEPIQKMNGLELGSLEESLVAEEPAMQASGDDDTISEIIKDDIQNSRHDRAGLGGAEETNLEGMEGLSTDNSQVLPRGEPTQKLPSMKGGPLEEFEGKEPVLHSSENEIAISAGVANDNAENDVGIETEQPGSLPAPLEDSREEDDELSPVLALLEDSRDEDDELPRASAEEVENSSTTLGSKEDKRPEVGIAHSRIDTKQQEIEELMSNDDSTDNLQEIARWPCSQHASDSNKRENDEVFTGAVGLQSRSTFSSKVLRYLPVEVALICLLIALKVRDEHLQRFSSSSVHSKSGSSSAAQISFQKKSKQATSKKRKDVWRS